MSGFRKVAAAQMSEAVRAVTDKPSPRPATFQLHGYCTTEETRGYR